MKIRKQMLETVYVEKIMQKNPKVFFINKFLFKSVKEKYFEVLKLFLFTKKSLKNVLSLHNALLFSYFYENNPFFAAGKQTRVKCRS